MFDQFLPSMASSYQIFFYLGVLLFVLHLILYGVGIDLSYFGILLIYIGWAKPQLSNWFRWVIWIFIVLDLWANFRVIRERVMKYYNSMDFNSSSNKSKDKKNRIDKINI